MPVDACPRSGDEQMNSDERTMRAWRLHEYGQPTEVLKLDTVAVPNRRRARSG